MDEKDRLGDKLHELEKGREDQFYAQRDRELLAKLKHAKNSDAEAVLKQAAQMRCPTCGEHLRSTTRHDIAIDECPAAHGFWVRSGELERIATRTAEPAVSRWLRALIRR
ncbi:MAG TPA: zf-TFIIB domain-containing protein [Candidatus Binatia bacterium]|nr:zf-TFIIB domain-containing protein [Candidatus Binatia bacterium]